MMFSFLSLATSFFKGMTMSSSLTKFNRTKSSHLTSMGMEQHVAAQVLQLFWVNFFQEAGFSLSTSKDFFAFKGFKDFATM